MRFVDQALQIVRATVVRMAGIGKNTVVISVAMAGKRADGHELQRCNAELDEMIELVDHALERPGAREGAHMQLVENG